MDIISLKYVKESIATYGQLKTPLTIWVEKIKKATWNKPTDVQKTFREARTIRNDRIVFNIAKNDFRVIVHCNYRTQRVFIKFIGTHAEYDKINPEKVQKT